MILGVTSVEGIVPQANKLFIFSEEMKNFLKSAKTILYTSNPITQYNGKDKGENTEDFVVSSSHGGLTAQIIDILNNRN